MIVFGERIDHFFTLVGITNTLLAAGLGNTLSDAVGIFSGRWVEKIVHINLPLDTADLSSMQVVVAETLGIIIGCLLGLFPLLLY